MNAINQIPRVKKMGVVHGADKVQYREYCVAVRGADIKHHYYGEYGALSMDLKQTSTPLGQILTWHTRMHI